MKIIGRYLVKEVAGLFSLSLFIITVLFMSQRIIQLTEWAVNRGVGPGDVLKLLIFLLPTVLMIIVPIVTLFAILLAVGRLSSDHEIVALKASGISLFRLFPPVVLFASLAFALGLFISWVLIPSAAGAGRALRYKIIRTRTEAAVAPETFIQLLPKTTFYVRDKKPDGRLKGVMAAVEDWPENSSWQKRQIVFARLGRFVHDEAALENELWLEDGVMLSEDRTPAGRGREDFAVFETCRIRLDLEKEDVTADDRRQELGPGDMMEKIADYKKNIGRRQGRAKEELNKLIIQWHERFAFPFACIALCFWAVPLGIQPPRAGRARAIVVSVLLSGFFYYLMILAKFGALKGWAPPLIMMWVPDLLIFVTGLYMLRQKNHERPILLLSRLEDQVYYLADRVKNYLEQRRSR